MIGLYFFVDFEKKIIKYLPNFCYLYQPSCFVQRSVSKYVQLFSFPFFITNMINIYKYIFTVIYIQEHKNFKKQFFLLFVVFSFTMHSEFYLQEHTFSPIAGYGFDSMQVYYSFVFQFPCLQDCSLLTSIQSSECVQ
jgi:hypothetical protein